MLATPSASPGLPPTGPDWVHEVKWDGVRLLADVRDGRVRLFNRTEGDITVAYPELVLPGLPPDLLVDGEVVALGASGVPSFQAIGHRMHVRNATRAAQLAASHPVTFMVFDVLRHDGSDLVRLPWARRRQVLESLGLPQLVTAGGRASWQVPDVHTDGPALAAATAAAGLEGVVSKRVSSVYRPGQRSPDWIKAPHRTELVAVIGGWVPETDTADRLGSVWVGHPTDEASFHRTGLLYPVSRVGSGLSHAERGGLLSVLHQISRRSCPFEPVPVGPEVRRTTWVDPAICVQIRYLGTTDTGMLRQPVMRALRPDVTPLESPTATLLTIPT